MAQYQFGANVWQDALAAITQPDVVPSQQQETIAAKSGGPEPDLEKLATDRLREGFAPPRQIYDVPNRERIDWSKVPEWARYTDPELFEGCAHEG